MNQHQLLMTHTKGRVRGTCKCGQWSDLHATVLARGAWDQHLAWPGAEARPLVLAPRRLQSRKRESEIECAGNSWLSDMRRYRRGWKLGSHLAREGLRTRISATHTQRRKSFALSSAPREQRSPRIAPFPTRSTSTQFTGRPRLERPMTSADNRFQGSLSGGKRCNAEGRLDAHHLSYENRGREEPKDLLALCGECHGLLREDDPRGLPDFPLSELDGVSTDASLDGIPF